MIELYIPTHDPLREAETTWIYEIRDNILVISFQRNDPKS